MRPAQCSFGVIRARKVPPLGTRMSHDRLVPLIIAVALFMENMDSTIIATSLPAIAADIGANPLALKLAVTSYLLSLAVFIPASGWTADRFGARTVFRAAIATFVVGSIGCALSGTLTEFVIARIVQGMGGAMMTPVGRVVHARGTPVPVLDFSLVRIPTFRANVVGGSLFRLGIGALAFLLPLMLQLGFNYTPLESGLVTFTAAVGAFTMKTFAARIIRRFGFRRILIVNSLIASALTGACGLFTPLTPFAVMIAVLLVGGFFRSLQFTATNVIAYADVDARRMSRATSLVSVAQQLSIAAGVAVGALAVELAVQLKGTGVITAEDFQSGFFLIGAISASSAFFFWTLRPDAGASMAHRQPIAAPDASAQRVG